MVKLRCNHQDGYQHPNRPNIYLWFNYCPWCGTKLEKPKPKGEKNENLQRAKEEPDK
jgi:hypothetical protein